MGILKELRENNCQPRITYLRKTPFKNNSEIQIFSDKENSEILFLVDFQERKYYKGSSSGRRKFIPDRNIIIYRE